MKRNEVEMFTGEDESRCAKIARIVARLPEEDQEKVLYLVKGMELAIKAKAIAKE